MARRLGDRQEDKRAALKEFAEAETGGTAAKPKARRAPKVKTVPKKYVGYYLPPELVKWVKHVAVEADAQPSHIIEKLLNEARQRAGGEE